MNQLTKKFLTELAVSGIIIIALSVGMLFFGSNIKKFSAKLENSKGELNSRGRAVGRLAELRRSKEEVETPYLTILYNLIPKKDELINISKEIQSLADAEQLTFGFSFTGETQGDENGLGSVRFFINEKGSSKEKVLGFIEALKNFQRLLTLEEISWSESREKTQATVKGSVFFRAES